MENKADIKVLLSHLAIYSFPFTGSLLITAKIPLSLPIFFALTILAKMSNYRIILGLSLLASAMFLSLGNTEIEFRSIFYICSFIITGLVYTLGFQQVVESTSINVVLKAFRRILTISSVFLIIEFIASNYGIDIVLPRRFDSIDKYDPLMMGLFNRSRGFARESGHMGLLYEMLVPILIFSRQYQKKLIELILWSVGAFVLGSPITLGLLILVFIYRLSSTWRLLFVVVLSVIASKTLYLKMFFAKVISASPSSMDRLQRLKIGLDTLYSNFWGVGPLRLDGYDSTLNLYLDIFVFFGWLVGLLFVLFVVISFLKSVSSPLGGLQISMAFILFHYFIIANFWYPFLWILIGISFLPKKNVVY